MSIPDLSNHPLCRYFLSAYLSKRDDQTNFPSDEFPAVFDRYERVFESALQVLNLSKEGLKSRPEFNFDSGDAANLESGIGVLRVVGTLGLDNFDKINLVAPKRNALAADITCEKNDYKVCVEVKTITKQSSGRPQLFLEDQLYEKILESIAKAGRQLNASAKELGCAVRIFACVVNWFEQSIYLTQDDYQHIVDKLERNQDQESLQDVDGVLIVTKMGERFLFLNERGKCIDR